MNYSIDWDGPVSVTATGDGHTETVHFKNELGKRIDIAVLIPNDARTLEFSIAGPTTDTTCGLTMMEARELVKLIRKAWDRTGSFPEPPNMIKECIQRLERRRQMYLDIGTENGNAAADVVRRDIECIREVLP